MREARVYSEIVPRTMPIEEMLAKKPKGIIFSGGPASVHVDSCCMTGGRDPADRVCPATAV